MAVDHSGFGEQGRELFDRLPAGVGAVTRGRRSPCPGAPSAASSFSADSGMYGVSSTVTTRRPSASERSVGAQLVGLGLVLGQLPRRVLLDVAVQPPHALPDALQRLRDLRLVEQRRDLLDEALEVGGQRRVDVDRRAPRRRSSGRACSVVRLARLPNSLASSVS